jgi:hypothetical protein
LFRIIIYHTYSHITNTSLETLKDGAGSIETQGCADQPLLDIASEESTALSFVHVVSQEMQKIQRETEESDTLKEATESSEEELFQSDDEESDADQKQVAESSDEEFEF